jgi:hypothetical protein
VLGQVDEVKLAWINLHVWPGRARLNQTRFPASLRLEARPSTSRSRESSSTISVMQPHTQLSAPWQTLHRVKKMKQNTRIPVICLTPAVVRTAELPLHAYGIDLHIMCSLHDIPTKGINRSLPLSLSTKFTHRTHGQRYISSLSFVRS